MAWIENLSNGLDDQKLQKETKIDNWLLNYWQTGNEKADSDFLKKYSWKVIVKSMLDDINSKSKEINNSESNEKIQALETAMKWYTKLWKLTQEQAIQLSQIYKQIDTIEATNHAEDAEWWEKTQKSMDESKKDYAQKLNNAIEKLNEFLKNNHEQAQQKIKDNSNQMQEARSQQQEPAWAYESLEFPPSRKESPSNAKA